MGELEVIILAGGLGKRMGDITKHKPKPLLLYQGKPLIIRIIDSLYQYSNKVNIGVKYLKEQFEDIPYSYKKGNLHYLNKDTMIGNFFEIAYKCKSNYILGISSDIVFDKQLIEDAFKIWESDDNKKCVNVFLTINKEQNYKRWRWSIENSILKDIYVEDNSTGYEKLFIIFPVEILKKYTNDFMDNLGDNDKEYVEYSKYNKGWIYLIKRLVDSKITIKAHILKGNIKNINRIDDLVHID